MSNLKNVVEELQNQQEGLNDVNSSIQQLIQKEDKLVMT